MKFMLMAITFIAGIASCAYLQKAVLATRLSGRVKDTISALIGILSIAGLILMFAFVFGDKNAPRPIERNYTDGSADPIEGIEQDHQECWDKQGNYEC